MKNQIVEKLAIALLALGFSVPIFAQPATQAEIAGEIAELALKLQATKEVEEHLVKPCIIESYKQGGWLKQGDSDSDAAILAKVKEAVSTETKETNKLLPKCGKLSNL